jgi:hypothetical protein
VSIRDTSAACNACRVGGTAQPIGGGMDRSMPAGLRILELRLLTLGLLERSRRVVGLLTQTLDPLRPGQRR